MYVLRDDGETVANHPTFSGNEIPKKEKWSRPHKMKFNVRHFAVISPYTKSLYIYIHYSLRYPHRIYTYM
jgi:hypothetical protein